MKQERSRVKQSRSFVAEPRIQCARLACSARSQLRSSTFPFSPLIPSPITAAQRIQAIPSRPLRHSFQEPPAMEPAKSTPPPAASANARNPFGYQTRLLERSASRSNSSFSLANGAADGAGSGSPAPRLPGATGLVHSGSVRRYPAPHRHTGSLDPARAAELMHGRSGGASPTHATHAEGHFGSNGSLASSSSSSSPAAARSPRLGSSSTFSTPASARINRHLSMPPAPREDPSTPTAVSRRPPSPTKASSPFARPASPTKYERPASPYKSSLVSPSSPGKADSSWVNSSPSTPSGSFWSQAASNSTAPSSHAPSAIHLGGVSDLKRSSVGALQMMRDFTTRADSVTSPDGPGHTRMTVGPRSGGAMRAEKGLGFTPEERATASYDEGFVKPARPGRMESEDQNAGEIVLPGITTGAEDVAGLQGRIRLARAGGAGSAALGRPAATSSLPFSAASKWMDTQRHLLQAYEYLCHCGEAKQWLEHCVGEELGDVVDMENEMRDGIILAKLARTFEPECVPRIFTHPKLQYRHTDNTNYFFRFCNKVELPISFQFELTDLYEKKNFPKVVYCIHALS
jgi:Ras GTPase-activating-like protein IQGAP2/3